MELTAATVSQIGMTLSIDVTLTDGDTTTKDTYAERSMRLLPWGEVMDWANRILKERWDVECEWYAHDRTAEWIVLEAAIGLPEEECEGPDEFFFPDGEVPVGWTSMSDD